MKKYTYITIIIFCCLFLICCIPADADLYDKIEEKGNAKHFNQGKLEYKKDVPYLKLSGDYFEMGLQYGVLMKDELKEVMDRIQKYIENIISNKPFYIRIFADNYLEMNVDFMEKRIPQKYRQELKGMAYGAGLKYDKLVFASLLPELMGTGCTSILQRIDDRIILGRNLDYHPHFLGDYPVVVEYNPRDGHSFVSVNIVGFAGVLTGMNDKGISLSLNQINIADIKGSKSTPIGMKNREILENCTSLKEVEKSFKGFKPDVSWIITVASQLENDGAIYDITDREKGETRLDDKDFLFATNFLLDKEMRKKYLNFLNANSYYNLGRYLGVKEQLDKGVDSVEEMINLLGSNYYGGYRENELGLMHCSINNEGAIESVVLDQGKEDIYFSAAPGFSGIGPFYKYNTHSSEVEIYKKGDSDKRKQCDEFVDKWKKIKDFHEKDEKANLVEYILSTPEDITIYEARQLMKAWRDNKKLVDKNKLRDIVNKMYNKYNQLVLPYIWLANLEIDSNKQKEGIKILEDALNMEPLLPMAEVEIYRLLARAYRDNNPDKAQSFGEKAIKLIKEYQIGEEEKEIIKDINSMIH